MLDKKALQDQMTSKVKDQMFAQQLYYTLNKRMGDMQDESARHYST